MFILYMKILYDMKFWFPTIFWPPKMGGRYLKMPFLATRWPKMSKRRVHCFLELLKIKRWTRKKNWFLTFLTPPPKKRHFLTKKRHFWPLEGRNRKKRGHIHMSILYMKILYDMKFWFATIFWPPKLGGQYLKTPFLDTRGTKLRKPKAYSYVHFIYEDIVWYGFLSFNIFSVPPMTPRAYFLTEKRHFWPLGGQIWKNRGHIHMSILYMKILYDMGFWFATFFVGPIFGPPKT